MKTTLLLAILFVILAGCVQSPPANTNLPETGGELTPVPPVVETPAPGPVVPESPAVVEPAPEDDGSPLPEPVPLVESFTLPVNPIEGAYNGTLVDTSMQIGNNPRIDQLFENMNQNGVHAFIGYFAMLTPFPEAQLSNDVDLGYIVDAVADHPGRIIPFFSLGLGGDETAFLSTNALMTPYRNSYAAATPIVGNSFFKGIGEIEQYAWDIFPTDVKMKTLASFATEHGMSFMFHPSRRQTEEVGELAALYPNTKFILHMFFEDFRVERTKLIPVMKAHPNLYFSIDVDHMLFLSEDDVGLLYKFEEIPEDRGAEFFIDEFDAQEEKLLSIAVGAYKPLVDAVPDQVMWGTEMSPAYNYDPDVYSRMIRYSRKFIGRMDVDVQERLAYQTAWNTFGPGATLTKTIPVTDAMTLPVCTRQQDVSCFASCDVEDDDEDTIDIAGEICLSLCTNTKGCRVVEDDEI